MASSLWFEKTPANSEDYIKRVYGDPNNNYEYTQIFDTPKFVTDREYFGDFGYGKCYNDSIESSVQCEIISDDSHDFNPDTLPFEQRVQWNLKEFSYKTSAHGLPQIGQAPNRYYRCIWIVLVIACVSMLYVNAHSVLNKYNRNEKIVDIQLKFDTAPFPAITICNLNPYKASVAKKVELIRKTLSAFDDAMNRAGIKDSSRSHRIKRLVKEAVEEAPYDQYDEGVNEEMEETMFKEAMGFEGMSDEVAIVTKAKENIMFAVTALPMKERLRLSHTKHDLVHKCSFGGVACDIEKDFLTHVDPIFGSCFTFNFNRSQTLSSIKAGPMYGLRMLVYVNASDYMPTTEATGIRITIHDKGDYPFPDTFGYSAPTGFISSFGLKLRKMSRLPAPYGDCLTDGKTDQYIYEDHEYSVEGCYRSCFQRSVLAQCQCGDPRFPVNLGNQHCQAADVDARKCLDERMSKLGGHQSKGFDGSAANDNNKKGICKCQQPCRESIYSVTYSPARWPSQSLQIQLGSCNSTPAECTRHYQENGAMIEVFYEQLNFEMLTESEAYGFVNLLADFGGQMGLWVGMSFLTCCEIIFLVVETLVMSIKLYLHKKRTISSSNDAPNQIRSKTAKKTTTSHKSKYDG